VKRRRNSFLSRSREKAFGLHPKYGKQARLAILSHICGNTIPIIHIYHSDIGIVIYIAHFTQKLLLDKWNPKKYNNE
jgi:hypothetical protein